MESGSEEEEDGDGKVRCDGASEYEKERLSRIAENRARMEALGLRRMASSLTTMMGSSSQAQRQSSRNKKSKAKVDEDDDDYRPEDDRPPSSSGEEDGDFSNEDDDGYGDGKSNGKRKVKKPKKKKMTVPKSRKKVSVKKVSSNSDYIDDDEDLKRAIALSLQESGVSGSDKVNANETKGMNQSKGDSGKNKRKNSFASRLQMTEDELILYFYQFDENWNDGISVRDLERVANQHDYTWTDKELAEMIHYFDSNGDGKISLDDFRKIAMRCKMIKGSQDS